MKRGHGADERRPDSGPQEARPPGAIACSGAPLDGVTGETMNRIALVMLCTLMIAVEAWGKTGRTYYDEELMAQVRAKIESEDWARGQVTAARDAAAPWIAMSDQELWDFVPPPGQLRALNVSFGVGCPVHGTEVFRRGGHYPWIMIPASPSRQVSGGRRDLPRQ